MTNKKLLSVLIFFCFLSLLILYKALNVEVDVFSSSITGKGNGPKEFTQFKELTYFNTNENTKKIMLKAEDLKMLQSGKLVFISPNGTFFNSDTEIDFTGLSGKYFPNKKFLSLSDSVVIKTQEGSSHSANKLIYNGKTNTIVASGDTKSEVINTSKQDRFTVFSDRVRSNLNKELIKFEGNVRANLIRNRNYEGKVYLAAQKMMLNRSESQAYFEGDVNLRRNKYYLHANKADLFLENFNKALKYYVLYDDIKLEEEIQLEDGTSVKRKAYSEKLEGYMRESKIVLSGAPRVEQGNDLIKGYQITLRENVELVEVDDSQTSFKIKRK